MNAFSNSASKSFEDRLVAHLNNLFPEICAKLGEARTRQMIQHGASRAAHYGFIVELDIARFVELMFTFGPEFDVKPSLAWARPFLVDRETAPPARMLRLMEESLKHLDQRIVVEPIRSGS